MNPQQAEAGARANTIILAPHFDDAVFSCGAWLAQLADEALRDIVLLTVCGGEIPAKPPETPLVRALHARWCAANGGRLPDRRAEERLAAATLSPFLRIAAAPYLDAIYRRDEWGQPLYAKVAQLAGAPAPTDCLPAQLRTPAGFALLADAQSVYLPLAVGGHVDHRIVRDWALEWLQARRSVVAYAYADFPYTRRAGAVAAALAGLPAPWRVQELPLTTTADPLASAVKVQAILAYRSQISSFWEDEASLVAEVHSTPERVWRLAIDNRQPFC